MGIKGLIPFLNEKVPGSMTEMSLESLSGESIAVDASTALYQFTIAIRDSSYFSSLVNASGESTSHLYGMMSRCSKLLECGIKPVFVFDSKPPELKLKTLEKRRQRREEASTSLKQAIAEGDKESIKKLMGRTVKVTKEMNDSAKKLLRLMGVPVIEAPEEAEAQCAYLVRNSLCRFVASEDTDTLAFGGGYLLRNVTASSNKKIVKVDLQKALKGLDLTFEQFVDFCILCGCDYCDTLEGVGPKTAYTLVKRHASLEEIVSTKGGNYDDFREAKEYFMAPKVNDFDQASVKMGTLDPEALTDFLVNENNFAKERVDKFVEKLLKFRGKKVQTSLLSFLTAQPAKTQLKDSGKRPRASKGSSSLKKSKTEFGSRASVSSSARAFSKKDEEDANVADDKYNQPDERVGNEEDEDDDFLKLSFDNDNNEEESSNVDDQSVSKSKEMPAEEDVKLELKLGSNKRVLFDDEDDELTTATSENMNCGTFAKAFVTCSMCSYRILSRPRGVKPELLFTYRLSDSIYTKAGGFNFADSGRIDCKDDPKFFTGHAHSSGQASYPGTFTDFTPFSRTRFLTSFLHNSHTSRIFARFIASAPRTGAECSDDADPTLKKVHKVEGVVIPEDLVKFIVVEEFVPLVTFHNIFSGDPSDLDGSHDSVFESNIFERNRLLHAERAALFRDSEGVDEAKRLRLKRLTTLSFSHGISWDTLDNLYFDFFRARAEALGLWEERKLDLVQFAREVALRRISSSDTLSQFRSSGRLLRLFTQQYYRRWLICYMRPFSSGMLVKYLKAHVTFALLNRECQELRGRGLESRFAESPTNPYFKNLQL
ncbi:5'-3' exonuclease [Theileria orientalis strain Shintoku]|uniref:Flap endonuclease 1 n=1 Tax=Theileria orientalis strain Shintoku TaxID=869250 RepID=J4DPG9_THEOR|nr:5'-3' exonuclease [Theileria orientalis strain Shintoku]BAM40684.1 5'-3' exonuclease [Theileria orientalis strain Shintoku]|eukprot:XP_009690985.1 5'-3' exonuclease [Theileria orientalis strain Shintoku]